MTVDTDGQVRRSDLVHAADYPLVVTGKYAVGRSEFTAHIADEDGLTAFLAAITRSPLATSPVRMFLMSEGYRPAKPLSIELPPSALYFDVDQEHQVAAAGVLVATTDGASSQWRTQGEARVDGVTLAQDPHNPEFTPFPTESFITVQQLRDAVFEWAFGGVIRPRPRSGNQHRRGCALAGGVRLLAIRHEFGGAIPSQRNALNQVMSSRTASGRSSDRSVRPQGSSRGIAGKSEPTSSRSGPSRSTR